MSSSKMDVAMAALSRHQISVFFRDNTQVTQSQCDQEAERIAGAPASPSPLQGGGSYTVLCGETVVQFRRPNSAIDFTLLKYVEIAYAGFVPRYSNAGELGGLPIYTMNNIGGVSMYLAREELYRDDYRLLKEALVDYAKFFSSPWHSAPKDMVSPDRRDMLNDYSLQLEQLAHGLPSRFRPTLDHLTHHLPSLFLEDWPMVPDHNDLLENNIHVDASTGRITGICDWRDTLIRPFGMSLWGLESMLGINKTAGWCYHTNHEALRELFWDEFYKTVEIKDRDRIEVARLVGIFLKNGWEYNDDSETVPAWEGTPGLNYLDEVALGIQGTVIVWDNPN